MDHREADVRQRTGFGDDTARFLSELRQLRDRAGLGHAELAAKAHYPYDSIKAAEVGPSLPDLPVLAAFVKGCGGTTEEWEERWRSLNSTPSLPVSTTRLAGNSPAATAGARIGSTAMEGETPDPSLILAALDRVADQMASGNDEPAEAQPLPATSPADPFAGDLAVADLDASDLGAAASGTSDLTAGQPTAGDAPVPPVPAWGIPDAAGAAAEAAPGAGMPAGWDPIRVSTAWPVIPASLDDTDLADAVRAVNRSGRSNGTLPPRDAGPGAGAPWTAAPWTASDAEGGTGQPAVRQPRAAGAAGRAAAASPGADGDASQAGRASRARMLAVCAVLLCVIAVVLAIFV